MDGLDEEELADESLLQLIGMVRALPAPTCHYRLQPREGDAGPLQADAELSTVEAAWREVFMAGDDADGTSCTRARRLSLSRLSQ